MTVIPIRRPLHRTVVALLIAPIVLGARADLWRRVAESHVKFAQALAADGVRLTPESLGCANQPVACDCTMSVSKPYSLISVAR